MLETVVKHVFERPFWVFGCKTLVFVPFAVDVEVGAFALEFSADEVGVSLDGRNVSVRCRTVGGVYTMTFAKERIVREASKAFKRVVK